MSEMAMRCVWVRCAKVNHHREGIYHNRMDRRVEAQSFANDAVEDGEFFHFFVCHGAKGSVRIGEMFQLFFI
jgi:hypothetical protein